MLGPSAALRPSAVLGPSAAAQGQRHAQTQHRAQTQPAFRGHTLRPFFLFYNYFLSKFANTSGVQDNC